MSVYKDKVVVITGAGGILCSEIAKEYAKYGAKIAVLDLNLEAAEKVAKEIVDNGGVAKAYKVNCLDKENMEQARIEINKDLGKCDLLVNGAGVQHRALAEDFPLAEWQKIINVNLSAVFALSQLAGRAMLARGVTLGPWAPANTNLGTIGGDYLPRPPDGRPFEKVGR